MMNNMIPLTIANTLDQSTKKRVEVAANQTVKEAVRQNNPTPMDTFDVYNGDGELISDEQAAHHRNSTLYVGVEKVVGGGVPRKRLGELQIEYPSIQPVKQWTDRKQAKMFLVRFPSNGRTQSGFWEIVIHCPNAGSALMHAYVLNFGEITDESVFRCLLTRLLLPTHAVLETVHPRLVDHARSLGLSRQHHASFAASRERSGGSSWRLHQPHPDLLNG